MPEFTRNLSFVIGINNYGNGIAPLTTAVNDAKKLVEILREQHGYQVWVCLDELATLKNLNQLLEKILPEQVNENDRLLFYFAGHGIALNGDDGPEGYLIPQDAKLGDVQTYLPMTKLQESLNKLPCRHFLGILDCCFAGAFRWSSNRDLLTTPEVIHKERYDRFITDPAWQVITSAASDQKALDAFALNSERDQRGTHSPFAAALIEALAGKADVYPPSTNGKPPGDGVITATELYLYLRDAVEPATEGNRQRQTPGIWPLKKHDKGEYIFLAPGHPLNLPPAPPLDVSKNPYRGLKSFDEEHSELFFGRNELVEKLHNFVKTHPLTVVLGASGSGKSSLVKAGLIPCLRQQASEEWYILPPIRPSEPPLRSLSQALASANLPEVDLTDSIAAWAANHPQSKLLLVIDQFEELFTLCRDEQEREQFFRVLAEAIANHPNQFHVVVTLRSDFEPQFVNTALRRYWINARFVVPAMTQDELRNAIIQPATARVMYFEPPSLVDQIIDEVVQMPGALPLLSFTLSELYLKYLQSRRNNRAITQQDYEELGGVIGSLTQRTEQEYVQFVMLDPAYQRTIRHVMLRMVAVDQGGLAGRQVPLSELQYPEIEENERVSRVIERLVEARLILIGQNAEGQAYVEPVHDVLIMGWSKLHVWINQERENLLLQQRLAFGVQDWLNNNQSEKWLWDKNPYLDVLKQVLRSDDNWFNRVETEFVQNSVRKQEGIVGNIKNIWERFTRGNRQPENEAQPATVETKAPHKEGIITTEPEITADTTSSTTEQTESSSSTVEKRNIYALLVGIDNYQDSVAPLNSCVNDVIALENYLNERKTDGYQLHLQKLIDHEATHQAVIDGFQQHLCQAGSEDVALFYFSGHGSQERAPSDLQLPEKFQGLLTTLVCWDSRSTGGFDLSGLELAYLITKVSEKNPHFVIILDCSHADFDTKALIQLIASGSISKTASPLNKIINLEDLQPIPESGLFGRHILLAACQSSETEKEYKDEYGQKYGAFTYFLLNILQRTNSNLTYKNLIRWVSALVRSKILTQTPQIRAMYEDDLEAFFGGNISESFPYFIVSYDKEHGWVIDGGENYGFPQPVAGETTLLALFPFDSSSEDPAVPSKSVAEAEIIEVLPLLSKINFINNIENLTNDLILRAVVASLPLPPLRVYFEGDEEGLILARQALQTAGIGRKQPSAYICEEQDITVAQFRLLCKDKQYIITRATENRPLVAQIDGYTPDNAKKAIQRLEHIARWTTIAELSNPLADIKAGNVEMELIFEGEKLSPSKQMRVQYKHQDSKWQPPDFRLKLTNKSQKPFYCGLVNLSDSFAISAPFFEAGSVKLNPGEEAFALSGEYFELTVPDELWEQGITEYKDIIKLIISNNEFDARLLTQNKLDAPRPPASRGLKSVNQSSLDRLMNRTQNREIRAKSTVKYDDWYTEEITITTVRPLESTPVSHEQEQQYFNRNFAIIIGINNYENGISALETAVPDAQKLAQILQEQHQNLKQQYQAQNKYEVQLLLNKRVTLSKLKELIEDFKQGQIPFNNEKVVVTQSDRVLFYFAGHGIALDALENQEGPVGYLIPQDATLGDSNTYLPMQELHDALNALPCRHMLAILDCCFAGAFRWASLKRDIVRKVTVYKERYDSFISDAAWQVITSAANDQKALDSLGQRGKVTDGNEVHSPFAKALFDALRGGADEGADFNKDGIITATELYSYLRDQVEILTENNYKRQTPGFCLLKKHDKGEFIFLLPNFDRDKLQDAPPLNPKNNQKVKTRLWYFDVKAPTTNLAVGEDLTLNINFTPNSQPGSSIRVPANTLELTVYIEAPGFYLQGEHTRTLPVRDSELMERSLTLNLTPLISGNHTISLSVYPGGRLPNLSPEKLPIKVRVNTPKVLPNIPELIDRHAIPAPDPHIILHVTLEEVLNKKQSTGLQRVGLYLTCPALECDRKPLEPLYFTANDLERLRQSVIQAAAVANGSPVDVLTGLQAIGATLFDRLMPREHPLRNYYWELFNLTGSDAPLSWLIVSEAKAVLPWELVCAYYYQDTGKNWYDEFLAQKFILAHWVGYQGLKLANEAPLLELGLTHYNQRPEHLSRWQKVLGSEAQAESNQKSGLLDLMQPSSSCYGLHILRYSDLRQTGQITSYEANAELASGKTLNQAEELLYNQRLDFTLRRPVVGLSLVDGQTANRGMGMSGSDNQLEADWMLPLMHAGASALVGSRWSVSPESDRLFYRTFYNLIRTGTELGSAVWQARKQLRVAFPHRSDWLAYTYFGHPQCQPYLVRESQGFTFFEAINPPENDNFQAGKSYEFRASYRSEAPVWYSGRLSVQQASAQAEDLSVMVVCLTGEIPPQTYQLQPVDSGNSYQHIITIIMPVEDTILPLLIRFQKGSEELNTLFLNLNEVKRGQS